MWAELRELWRYRELLLTYVLRDLRVRYKNSALGFFWSLLNPLATVLVMTVVFKHIMGFSNPNYSAYLLAAYLPWVFFQMTLMDSSQCILLNMPVIRKVYFPREILPLTAVCANLVHFLLALFVFFCYLLVVWLLNPQISPFSWKALWVFPLILGHGALAAGLALFVSALNTFYEDVKYILGVVLYLLFFLCPVIYFSENVANSQLIAPEHRRAVYVAYHLNPVAMYLTAYRKVLLPEQGVQMRSVRGTDSFEALPLEGGLLASAVGLSVVALVGGYAYFNRRKWEFVERP